MSKKSKSRGTNSAASIYLLRVKPTPTFLVIPIAVVARSWNSGSARCNSASHAS